MWLAASAIGMHRWSEMYVWYIFSPVSLLKEIPIWWDIQQLNKINLSDFIYLFWRHIKNAVNGKK